MCPRVNKELLEITPKAQSIKFFKKINFAKNILKLLTLTPRGEHRQNTLQHKSQQDPL